jgi:hypothetical protein
LAKWSAPIPRISLSSKITLFQSRVIMVGRDSYV